MTKQDEAKQGEKKPEPAENQAVPPMSAAQSTGLRLLIVETDGIRINVKMNGIQMLELQRILQVLDQMAQRAIDNAGPLHPPAPAPLKIQAPAGEAKA